jgi:hypothetical protein
LYKPAISIAKMDISAVGEEDLDKLVLALEGSPMQGGAALHAEHVGL